VSHAGAGYRISQALAASTARMSTADREEATDALPPELRALFLEMAVRDQRHSLEVLRRLRQAAAPGGVDALLEQAALLHDVGKARAPLGTPGRSLLVLAEAFGGLGWLCRLPLLGSRVARYITHPAIGAAILREAGAPAALVEIVAEHQHDRPQRPETLRLQAADGRE
jgi:putative nucleotidyltransferase with HDIG domain